MCKYNLSSNYFWSTENKPEHMQDADAYNFILLLLGLHSIPSTRLDKLR